MLGNKWTDWFLKTLFRDGLLPLVVVATPDLVRLIVPDPQPLRNQMNALEAASLLVPVGAFVYRIMVGRAELLRLAARWRWAPFVVGLMVLALGETAYILIRGVPEIGEDPREATAPLFAVYLVLMGLAFIPIGGNGPVAGPEACPAACREA